MLTSTDADEKSVVKELNSLPFAPEGMDDPKLLSELDDTLARPSMLSVRPEMRSALGLSVLGLLELTKDISVPVSQRSASSLPL